MIFFYKFLCSVDLRIVWFHKISITPIMEGIGNSRGVGGGSLRSRKFRRGGGEGSVKLRFQMVKFDAVMT